MIPVWVALSLITGAFAASPRVGDSATLEGTAGGSKGVKIKTVQKILAYDTATTKYTVEQTKIIGDEMQVAVVTLGADDGFLTDDVADHIVENCEANHLGTRERITVPAGTFTTCRVGTAPDTLWLAKVPFGIVRMLTKSEAGTTKLELTEFTHP